MYGVPEEEWLVVTIRFLEDRIEPDTHITARAVKKFAINLSFRDVGVLLFHNSYSGFGLLIGGCSSGITTGGLIFSLDSTGRSGGTYNNLTIVTR